MKTLLGRLRNRSAAPDSGLATTLQPPIEPPPAVAWAQRMREVGARPFDSKEAARRLVNLWRVDPGFSALDDAALQRLAAQLEAAVVDEGADLVRQDETSTHLLVLLEGRVAIEQVSPRGKRTPLAEARGGDLLGEPGSLDAGPRTAMCRTLVPSIVAAIELTALQRLVVDDAPLAAALYAAIARRLSLRLRQTGARLGALLSPI
ncbi:cyclic nucleotide-binding domain-containing protein [Ideonella sp. A 288]|uniref:cyclic nucleotide-binding domain-containing protein n=1 Tax=Ideonella sp. A 288 TaxID=1962181 RepID=UPI001185A796|nr:cyclic nucleotide-binding domain-containing protein [Ideonella sp. A 288]